MEKQNFTLDIKYIVILLIIVTFVRSMIFYWMAMKASISFHQKMIHSLLRAKMDFFHNNPSGRILNRFSQDIGSIDDLLPFLIIDVIQAFLQLLGIVVIVSFVNIWLLLPMIAIAICVLYIKNFYLPTSIRIKRVEGITRSPVFSHLSASMQGMVTIRAMNAEQIIIKEFDSHQDQYTSASYIFLGTSRAFAYWLDLICVVFIGIVTFSFLWNSGIIGGNVGLAITQVIGLTTLLQWGIRQATVLENQMISVERVQEYTDIESEPPLSTSLDEKLPLNWPEEGAISFQNVYLRYASDGPPLLNDISFAIGAKQKIGIVGRTGSGKTSIVNALLRLAHTEGKITLDDVDITTIGIHKLRSSISVISQEPVLFSGTLRNNLDPFDKFSDELLWNVLEKVELKATVSELKEGLNCNMNEGGSNFSVGQRQLICLARTIIHGNRIIILDEATANVDNETDAVIQATIRNKFADCTILTIAHRLQTIMDSDKVLVMDSGRIVEFDEPLKLLQNKESAFLQMVELTGQATSDLLKIMANSKST